MLHACVSVVGSFCPEGHDLVRVRNPGPQVAEQALKFDHGVQTETSTRLKRLFGTIIEGE